MSVLTPYPSFRVMESASPPVSPTVVAQILIIQNARVTSGTLLSRSILCSPVRIVDSPSPKINERQINRTRALLGPTWRCTSSADGPSALLPEPRFELGLN